MPQDSLQKINDTEKLQCPGFERWSSGIVSDCSSNCQQLVPYLLAPCQGLLSKCADVDQPDLERTITK